MIEGVAVGRIVHFVDTASRCRAAIITDRLDNQGEFVNLKIFDDTDTFRASVEYSMDNKEGTWHWPERV